MSTVKVVQEEAEGMVGGTRDQGLARDAVPVCGRIRISAPEERRGGRATAALRIEARSAGSVCFSHETLAVSSACPHVDEVRQELARELHDTVVQRLNVAVVELELLRRLEAGDMADHAARLQRYAREALEGIRVVISGLRDDPTTSKPFVELIRAVLAEFSAETGIATGLDLRAWPDTIPAAVALHARRIIEEALSNVRRHSGASRVDVSLEGRNGMLELTVRDDGRAAAAPRRAGGFGITGMQERAALLGGRLRVEAAPGHGTTVRGLFPAGCTA